jgi:YVTN family beta-propeller protein
VSKQVRPGALPLDPAGDRSPGPNFIGRSASHGLSRLNARRAAVWLCTLALLPAASLAAPPRTLPLGAPDKWQYAQFDAATDRLFVAHGTEITVVDTAAMRVAGRITGLSGAHDVALVPGGHGYADSGKTGIVSVFDPATLRVIAKIPADDDAYAMVYDPPSGRVFVMNDDAGNITVIDSKTDHVTATIPVGAGLESAASDGQGRIYVNHPEQREVLRIDTARLQQDATWKVPQCQAPQGLALDPAAHRIFISCENAVLLVLDAGDGSVIADLPIGRGSDSVLFDPVRHRIYSPNADGTLSIIEARGLRDYRVLPPFVTAPGARTGALDRKTGRLFLVTADVAHQDPPKHPGGAPSYRFQPGTVKLLIYDPAP